ERTEDIPMLVEHFAQKQGNRALHFSKDALELLMQYSWPGNVRELSNLVAYASTMAEGDQIEIQDLPTKFHAIKRTSTGEPDPSSGELFYQRIAQYEKTLLREEYRSHDGNISQLAAALGMDRSHLYAKLKNFGIHSARERGSLRSSESKKPAQ